MMQKLMEINDQLVRTLAERDELRKDQTKLQGICADGGRRIAELQAERDCLQAELDRTREQFRNDQKTLQEISSVRLQRITELQAELRKAYAERDEAKEHATRLQAELDATRKQLQDVCSAQSVRSAGQSDLVRDVSHYTEAAEVDRPTEPQPQPEPKFKPYTFAAYIVGDKIQPDALRIVWATEEWIEQSKFGIVHAMKDIAFLDQDRFTPEQFSLTLMLSK